VSRGLFNGILSNVKLTDLTTPTNSLEFKLNELTQEYELPVNNVYGSEAWTNPPSAMQGQWTDEGDGVYAKNVAIYGYVGEHYTTTTTVSPNTSYEVTVTVNETNDQPVSMRTRSTAGDVGFGSIGEGTHTVVVTTGDLGGIWFGSTAFQGTISNISIKEVTNAINYVQIAPDVRDTYKLVDGKWLGSELWTGVVTGASSVWADNGGGSYSFVGGGNILLSPVPTVSGGVYEVTGIASALTGSFKVGDDATVNTEGAFKVYTTAATSFAFARSLTSTRVTISDISVKRLIDVSPQITPVTQSMSRTEAWDTRGTAYTGLDLSTVASVRVDATISNTDTGILMEAGGGSAGLVLYVFSGVLYFQCGNGSNSGPATNRAVLSYTLPIVEADYIIEWSANRTNAVLYVNGTLIEQQAYSYTQLAGNDGGTVGTVNKAAANNRGGWIVNGNGVYTNSITKCDIFKNQVTADV
jgi:hypothetical protein